MKNGHHGVTENTSKNLLIDAGKIVLNYGLAGERDLGATLGGNSFQLDTEIRWTEPDGARGKVKGFARIIKVEAKLVVKLLEITKENLLLAIPGATTTDYPDQAAKTHDSIRRFLDIQDADYIDNVALIGTISGATEPIIIIIENVLNESGLSAELVDKDEAVPELTLAATFDPANLDQEPWEIRQPLIAP